MGIPCEQRKARVQEVSNAIATIDRLNRELESAKRSNAASIDDLRVALIKARAAGRDAQRAFETHVRQHHCKF
jgi:hypothetical protein